MTDVSVTRSATLDAPLEKVWDAITDPAALAAWLGDEVELDVRPGGVGRIRLPDGDRSVLVTAVEEGRRLSLLWWGEESGEVSSVELTLSEHLSGPLSGPPSGSGRDGVELVVVERLLIPAARASVARVSMGMRWGCAFALLSTVCLPAFAAAALTG